MQYFGHSPNPVFGSNTTVTAPPPLTPLSHGHWKSVLGGEAAFARLSELSDHFDQSGREQKLGGAIVLAPTPTGNDLSSCHRFDCKREGLATPASGGMFVTQTVEEYPGKGCGFGVYAIQQVEFDTPGLPLAFYAYPFLNFADFAVAPDCTRHRHDLVGRARTARI
jgi:hypothetical protein